MRGAASSITAGGTAAKNGLSRGLAFSRYKNKAAYAAVVADVEVGDDIRVR